MLTLNRSVATMGAGYASKKKIQAVDVPRACKTISDPTPPIALRLQATLLHGTSAVFGKQADYLLSDTQRVFVNLETFSRSAYAQNDRPEARNL